MPSNDSGSRERSRSDNGSRDQRPPSSGGERRRSGSTPEPTPSKRRRSSEDRAEDQSQEVAPPPASSSVPVTVAVVEDMPPPPTRPPTSRSGRGSIPAVSGLAKEFFKQVKRGGSAELETWSGAGASVALPPWDLAGRCLYQVLFIRCFLVVVFDRLLISPSFAS